MVFWSFSRGRYSASVVLELQQALIGLDVPWFIVAAGLQTVNTVLKDRIVNHREKHRKTFHLDLTQEGRDRR
jgi:hypothetical protein